jgi:hypothetical protein
VGRCLDFDHRFLRLAITFLLVLCLAVSPGWAREPNVGLNYPPGLTLGIANAVPLSPGLRISSRATYGDSILVGNNGQPTGYRFNVATDTVMVTWAPGWELFGASYKTFVLAPFINSTVLADAPLPRGARGTWTKFGMANPKLQPLDLSWTLGDGFYANAGFGIYFPIGQWDARAPVNVGSNFWTFEPSAAFSYYKDSWTLSLQALYTTNTTNPTNQYYSGDQLFLNATAMKMIAGVNFGPVGYWAKQVTNDANYGGNTVFGGTTALPGEQFAIGGTMSTQFGKLSVQLMVTQDVYAQNATYGTKAWLNFSYRLY